MSALLKSIYDYVFHWVVVVVIAISERNLMPDIILRLGMRFLIRQRVTSFVENGVEKQETLESKFVAELKTLPIAVQTAQANEQHYEVPTDMYLLCLGKRLKYSSCYFPTTTTTLDEAENYMFELYCQRAALKDGMRILDLGCGWGSLSLFLAEKYPKSTIFSISNSRTQKQFIDQQAQARGLTNVTVLTCDINEFDFLTHGGTNRAPVDRVMSIEMFEHMKNYELLMGKISKWLSPNGRLFVHIFTFAHHSYHFEARDASDWMTTHFFSGGTMPAANLLFRFQRDLLLLDHWRVNGNHYSKTLEAWLTKFDRNSAPIRAIFEKTYGRENATMWIARWRMFFMACSELFALDHGNQFFVSMYLFENRAK